MTILTNFDLGLSATPHYLKYVTPLSGAWLLSKRSPSNPSEAVLVETHAYSALSSKGVFLSFFHKIIYWFRIFFSNFLFPGILQVSLSLVNITPLFFSLSYECLPLFLYYLLSASNFSSRLNLKKTDQMCATHQIPSMSTKPNKITQ